MSILLLYLEVFKTSVIRKLTWAAVVVVAIYSVWIVVSSIVACVPVHAYWDDTVPDAWCFPRMPKWMADAAFNIVSDLVIFCLPMPVVRSMTLPRRQKVWLYCIFGLGFLYVPPARPPGVDNVRVVADSTVVCA